MREPGDQLQKDRESRQETAFGGKCSSLEKRFMSVVNQSALKCNPRNEKNPSRSDRVKYIKKYLNVNSFDISNANNFQIHL